MGKCTHSTKSLYYKRKSDEMERQRERKLSLWVDYYDYGLIIFDGTLRD